MAKIAIIGNSAAGFSCCQTLLNNSHNHELCVISSEDIPAYRRDKLVDYLGGRVGEDELMLCARDFYEKNKISFFNNRKVARIDTRRNIIVLKDGQKIVYEFLVIASGQKAVIPEIPGDSKTGVFSFYNFEDARKIKEHLAFNSETVCLVGEKDSCLAIWEAIKDKAKEIKIISSQRPQEFVSDQKNEWIEGLEVSELIGEGAQLMAMKLNNGKVIGTSLTIFLQEYKPQTEFLKETEVICENRYIVVDESMRTNIDNIFSCGSVCRAKNGQKAKKNWDDCLKEGVCAGASLINFIERGKILCQ